MRKKRKLRAHIFWAQLIVTFIWYVISVIAWMGNPKGSPNLDVPLLVRGAEFLSIILVSGAFILVMEFRQVNINRKGIRVLLLLILYPGSILTNYLSLGIRALIGYSPPPIGSFFYIHSLYYYVPMLLVMVAYAYVKNQQEITREKEKTLEAETLAQQARWMMLRYQVNPHFLFNALNTIRALIGKDDANARRIVTELSEYFRYSLARDKETLVTVKEELMAVKSYLEIQKIRFREKLHVSLEEDPDSLACTVPVFAVQTLVENGVKYGMLTSDESVYLEIICILREERLYITVSNSGSFLSRDQHAHEEGSSGIGLDNLKARLQYLDPTYRFELIEEEGRVVACLVLTAKIVENGSLESTHH